MYVRKVNWNRQGKFKGRRLVISVSFFNTILRASVPCLAKGDQFYENHHPNSLCSLIFQLPRIQMLRRNDPGNSICLLHISEWHPQSRHPKRFFSAIDLFTCFIQIMILKYFFESKNRESLFTGRDSRFAWVYRLSNGDNC